MRVLTAIAVIVGLGGPVAALAELRVYDVEPQYRQEVYEALNTVLADRPQPIGRVERLPSGQLLIDAAPAVHDQVASILATIAAQQPTAAPRVTLRYWAVLGQPDAADDDAIPAVLDDVLDEIEAVHGELGFRVLGNASLVTESGQSGEFAGFPLTVSQETYAQGATLNARIEIEFVYPVSTAQVNASGAPFQPTQLRAQDLELRTTLEAGEILVLGENTLGENAIDAGGAGGTLFYIVQWPGNQ